MPSALYYPFHLCHPRSLEQLLARYDVVHFRDYMALQITPFSGTTAFPDRMGDGHPDLVRSGRLIQGHRVSGPISDEMAVALDRDLADGVWRLIFHQGVRDDRRFQRGLFNLSHSMSVAGRTVPGPAALLQLLEERRATNPWTVARLRAMMASAGAADVEAGYEQAYGLALIQTAAALWHTVRIAAEHRLVAVTDSPVHDRLLARARDRDALRVEQALLIE